MTTDHDPRELRAYAQARAKVYDPIGHSCPLSHYVLATVREDDGEEQESETTGWYDGLSVAVVRSLNYVQVSIILAGGQSMVIPFKSFTRGQFRALCRGLGIVIE